MDVKGLINAVTGQVSLAYVRFIPQLPSHPSAMCVQIPISNRRGSMFGRFVYVAQRINQEVAPTSAFVNEWASIDREISHSAGCVPRDIREFKEISFIPSQPVVMGEGSQRYAQLFEVHTVLSLCRLIVSLHRIKGF